MEDVYVVGDIHGCYNTFMKLYDEIKGSKIILVGDLLDKGHDSKKVIDFCIENNIESIRGNHEQLFLDNMVHFLNDNINIKYTKWFNEWGGDTTMKSYDYDKEVIKRHISYIEKLPHYKEIEVNGVNFFITHGFGLPYYDDKTNIRALMSNRLYGHHYDVNNVDELSKFNVVNIFGHDAFTEVKRHKLYVGIDTGCAYGVTSKTGGKLTALKLNDMITISVDVIDKVTYSNDYY